MEEKDRRLWRTLGVLSTVGISMVLATLIGLFVGLKLDAWLGTSPWLTAVFLLLGIIAGFRNLVVYARRGRESLEDMEKEERDDRA